MSYWASSAYVDMPAAHPVAILITELWGKLAKRDTTLHLSQMHFAGREPLETGLIRLNRGAAVWFWMALAVIGGCRPTVLGGVDSRAS